jgi:hypothetical protein
MPFVAAAAFELSIFPPNGFGSSLVTAILLGLLVLFVMNELFGWVFTGLVVPGYLAAVFIIQPVTGTVMAMEALAAYLAARFLCDNLAHFGLWSRFFGRERFFIVVLCSVVVRIVSEAAFLPWLITWTPQLGWDTTSVADHLYSIGLIVVPLASNMMWKMGLLRGLPQVILPTIAVYAVLKLVLVPFTNLSLSSFELSYEDMALGFLSSPRAYIMLLAGAWVGAHTNVRWGWDSSGIMVLALLSLAWLTPGKVLVTVIETTLLAIAAVVVTGLPGLRTSNLEGGRLIALVFSLAYLLKWLGSALAWQFAPDLRVTDLFGFGYLLTALLALKVVQKGWPLIMLPALESSFAVAVLATVLGFAMAITSGTPLDADARYAAQENDFTVDSALAQLHLASSQVLQVPVAMDRTGINTWVRSARAVLEPEEDPLALDPDRFAQRGLRLRRVLDRHRKLNLVMMQETSSTTGMLGRGTLAVRRKATCPLMIVIPHPVREELSLLAGAAVFLEMEFDAMFVSGADPPGEEISLRDAEMLDRVYPQDQRLVVRAGAEGNRLLLRRSLPHCLDLGLLQDRLGSLEIESLSGPSSHGIVLELSWEGMVALGDLARELEGHPVAETRAIVGLRELPLEPDDEDQPSGALRRLPTWEELRYLDHEVLSPLLRDPAGVAASPTWTAVLDMAAANVGYQLRPFDLSDGSRVLLLHELARQGRGWGSVLLRPAGQTGLFIAVPEREEDDGALIQALNLADAMDAAAVVIEGTRGSTGALGIIPRQRVSRTRNLMTRVHRIALANGIAGRPVSGLQLRGFGTERGITSPSVLAVGKTHTQTMGPALEELRDDLRRLGLAPTMIQGDQRTTGLGGSWIPQVALARRYSDHSYALLWTSAHSKRRFDQAWQAVLAGHATELGARRREGDLEAWWSENAGGEVRPFGEDMPEDLWGVVERFRRFRQWGNLREYREMLEFAGRKRMKMQWFVDLETQAALLMIGRTKPEVVLLPGALGPEVSSEETDPVGALRCGMVMGYWLPSKADR